MKYTLQNKNILKLILNVLIFCCAASSGNAQKVERLSDGSILLENFQSDSPGTYPDGWYDRDGNAELKNHSAEDLKGYHYSIKQEGNNKFLHYKGKEAKHIDFPLINKNKDNIYGIDLKKTPILSWDWRIHRLPEGANEDDSDLNDAAASIYVVFDFGHVLFKKVPKTIRYTWSSTLPKGKKLSKFFGNQKIIVLKSGKKDTGKWVHFSRNIAKDYKNLFGDEPPKTPLAILLLSDGDSTDSIAEADFDNIMLQPLSLMQ